jgi:hypothetical protein
MNTQLVVPDLSAISVEINGELPTLAEVISVYRAVNKSPPAKTALAYAMYKYDEQGEPQFQHALWHPDTVAEVGEFKVAGYFVPLNAVVGEPSQGMIDAGYEVLKHNLKVLPEILVRKIWQAMQTAASTLHPNVRDDWQQSVRIMIERTGGCVIYNPGLTPLENLEALCKHHETLGEHHKDITREQSRYEKELEDAPSVVKDLVSRGYVVNRLPMAYAGWTKWLCTTQCDVYIAHSYLDVVIGIHPESRADRFRVEAHPDNSYVGTTYYSLQAAMKDVHELYANEFKPSLNWKLVPTSAYGPSHYRAGTPFGEIKIRQVNSNSWEIIQHPIRRWPNALTLEQAKRVCDEEYQKAVVEANRRLKESKHG